MSLYDRVMNQNNLRLSEMWPFKSSASPPQNFTVKRKPRMSDKSDETPAKGSSTFKQLVVNQDKIREFHKLARSNRPDSKLYAKLRDLTINALVK